MGQVLGNKGIAQSFVCWQKVHFEASREFWIIAEFKAGSKMLFSSMIVTKLQQKYLLLFSCRSSGVVVQNNAFHDSFTSFVSADLLLSVFGAQFSANCILVVTRNWL